MEMRKQELGYHNQWHMEDSNGAHASTSTLHSIEPLPGVTQDEYGKVGMDEDERDVVLIFPEGEQDAVTITNHDMEGLQPGGLLSGNIIHFYIKYLQNRLCFMNKDCVHFFNAYFFTKLVEVGRLPREQRDTAYEKVQKWAGKVNVFEKKFVFIPVHQSSHWSLIIICHLSSLTNSPDEQECQPCILHLDSVRGTHKNLEDHILRYILHAWPDRHHKLKVDQLVAWRKMNYEELKVPQQENHYDCGIYLLHFIELFIRESLNVDFVPNQESLFTPLWGTSEVSAKRRDIEDLILELSLASRRKSRERETGLSQLYQRRPVFQISDVLETHLDGNVTVSEGRTEDLRMHDTKQLNAEVDGAEYPDHQKPGEVALVDNQQHTGTMRFELPSTVEYMLDDQQQCEQLACAPLKPAKRRRKRCNWAKDETWILLSCMKERGHFCKGDQASTNWTAVSQEIAHQFPGTRPTADQCRLRYDTLLKAYKTSKDHCMQMGKQFRELHQGELKLATHLTEDWYNAIDEICQHLHHKARSPKPASTRKREGRGAQPHPWLPLIDYEKLCVNLHIPSGEGSGGREQAAGVRTHFLEGVDGVPAGPTKQPPSQIVETQYRLSSIPAPYFNKEVVAGVGSRGDAVGDSGGGSGEDSGGIEFKHEIQNRTVGFGGEAGGNGGGDAGGGSNWMLSNLPFGLLSRTVNTIPIISIHVNIYNKLPSDHTLLSIFTRYASY